MLVVLAHNAYLVCAQTLRPLLVCECCLLLELLRQLLLPLMVGCEIRLTSLGWLVDKALPELVVELHLPRVLLIRCIKRHPLLGDTLIGRHSCLVAWLVVSNVLDYVWSIALVVHLALSLLLAFRSYLNFAIVWNRANQLHVLVAELRNCLIGGHHLVSVHIEIGHVNILDLNGVRVLNPVV